MPQAAQQEQETVPVSGAQSAGAVLPSGYQARVRPHRQVAVGVAGNGAVGHVIEQLLVRSGLTMGEAGRRMGFADGAAISQVKHALSEHGRKGRRRPSFEWIVRFAAVCGGRVFVEFPSTPIQWDPEIRTKRAR